MRPMAPLASLIFYSVVEPSENGSGKVGAFAKIRVEGKDLMVWREEDETNENFEVRMHKLECG